MNKRGGGGGGGVWVDIYKRMGKVKSPWKAMKFSNLNECNLSRSR